MNSCVHPAARLSAVLIPVIFSLSSQAWAFERDHDAHEHGHGQLLIALEDQEVELMFTSPAMDIVGFEHAPESAADKAAVAKAAKLLEVGADLFIFNQSAQCQLEHAHVESALLEDGDHHEEHEEEHEHEDDHDHNGHEEDAHEHGEGEAHSEFAVEYHFECAAPAQLKSLQVELFTKFPAMQEIEVQVAGPKGQQRLELDAGQARVPF